MGTSAHEGGALDSNTKELLAVAISVAVRCDPCITFHVEGARKHGATRQKIAETMGLAVYMGTGPSAMYAAHALEAYDQYTDQASGEG
ncbi:carboxymuconolactone decarboxylase family protein [Alteriqipengyuania flavescens]|uniref:carboxymuconolactone decarboxylase family protein n=1 Tax=Alteriqipengyuania flavescens TaxID=3053610 RepID=UPI0025B3B238|nr:carboxymuconolactone decarboxylase family protein [Alteriqipengyuania flavescens]WJY19202.1 carboxymuconolactone decarboxylase family protein [Alteriqipengyuania flavescens]WJY25142.1 carboxymuconolactone decarboxylase family protein [Alteriqipengyuania flavescens]